MFFIHFAHGPSHPKLPPNIRRILRKGSQTYHEISRLDAKRWQGKITPKDKETRQKHYAMMIGLQSTMQPYRKAIAQDLAARLRKATAAFATHQPDFHRMFRLAPTTERFAAHLEKSPTSYHILSMYGGVRALESLARVARERSLNPMEMRGIKRIMDLLSEAIRKSEME